jgi:MoxR-like ATPase
VERETRIIMARVPHINSLLASQIAAMVAGVRQEELRKVPGVAETLDWAAALVGLGVPSLHADPQTVHQTLRCLLKTQEDRARLTPEVAGRLLGKVA